jgi:hypothetical protein
MSVVYDEALYRTSVQFPRFLDVYSRDNICLCHTHEGRQSETDHLQAPSPVCGALPLVA